MSLIPNSQKSYKATSRISYVAVTEFSSNFFNYYTTFTNLITVGNLVPVTGGSGNCPAGRILRENGRKLYPGGAYPSVTTYMIGVYDSISMLSGFIDPNAPQFAVYNTDKPNTVIDGVDPVGLLTDLGPPVYTNGSITGATATVTGTGLTPAQTALEVTNGTISVLNGQIVTAIGQIRASNVVGPTITGNYSVDPSLGQIFNISLGTTIGATVSINITNTDSSQIGAIVHLNIANYRTAGNCDVTFTNTGPGSGVRTPGVLTITNGASGMFSVAFLIVNNNHVVEISRTAALNKW